MSHQQTCTGELLARVLDAQTQKFWHCPSFPYHFIPREAVCVPLCTSLMSVFVMFQGVGVCSTVHQSDVGICHVPGSQCVFHCAPV